MSSDKPISVLFICMGNICRSPTAEGVFRHQVAAASLGKRIVAASAGTHAYHVGEPPDHRAQAAALRRGYDLSAIRARRVVESDFHEFDRIVAMDRDNLAHLQEMRPSDATCELSLLLAFGRDTGYDEVPDPYYGGARGFETVLDLIEDASKGLLQALRSRL